MQDKIGLDSWFTQKLLIKFFINEVSVCKFTIFFWNIIKALRFLLSIKTLFMI